MNQMLLHSEPSYAPFGLPIQTLSSCTFLLPTQVLQVPLLRVITPIQQAAATRPGVLYYTKEVEMLAQRVQGQAESP